MPGVALLIATVVLVALNLRLAIASLPPLVERIGDDLGLGRAWTGALTTLPVLCMGLFAPVGALAARRFGSVRVLAGAVVLIAVGTALRAIPQLWLLYGATALVGVGIAVAGSLLPPLVRARFPGRIGPVTGLYTAGLIGGALLAASLTAPLPLRWPLALAVWAVPAVVALVVWLFVAGPSAVPSAVPAAAPWRSRRAWFATFFMGGQSLLYYASLAWLAARYTALGSSASAAGLLLGLFSATQLVSSLGMPLLAHRFGDPRPWIAVSLSLTGISLALVAFAPDAAAWVWASVLGLGVGGQFALAMMVLSTLGATAQESAAATGMALFGGYLLAATGPVAAGALVDLTGSYAAPFAALAVFAVPVLLAGLRAASQ
jgi:MFS transporter, CP family, cyanate transporter